MAFGAKAEQPRMKQERPTDRHSSAFSPQLHLYHEQKSLLPLLGILLRPLPVDWNRIPLILMRLISMQDFKAHRLGRKEWEVDEGTFHPCSLLKESP